MRQRSGFRHCYRSLCGFAAALVAGSHGVAVAQQQSNDSPNRRAPAVVLTDDALTLHRGALVVDGHNDLPWAVRKQGGNVFATFDIAQPQPSVHTDIPRLRQGGVGAQFWSVYVPAETAYDGTAMAQTIEQIELVKLMIDRYPGVFELARSTDDIRRIHRAEKIASLIGVEGGYSMEESLTKLRKLYELGARYMTLTHSDTLSWADSATDLPRHGGLTEFGKEVVREMNRLGMLVDISHVSVDVMQQAIATSAAPVIFSHSSARAIADHPRNVPDDVLRMLPEKDGVVMVNFYSGFVQPQAAAILNNQLEDDLRVMQAENRSPQDRPRTRPPQDMPRGTIHDVLDHIAHIAEVAGSPRHVGLGSDYDGVGLLPEQLDDVSCYPYLTQGLLDRGCTPDEVRGILGENLMRVFRAAEATAERLRR